MNIYVGNVSRQVDENILKAEFARFGEVTSVSINKDKQTGLSIGIAYVELPNQEEANAAIKSLNGKDLKGQKLIVKEARVFIEEQPGKSRQGGNAKSGPGARGGGFNNTSIKKFGVHRKSG